MKYILIVFLVSFSTVAKGELHSTELWVSKYISKCNPKTPNHVCINKTKRNFRRMLKYKKMMFKYLDSHKLPRWLATIPFIESEYVDNAISPAGAIGLWQIMPGNIQHYRKKTRVVFKTVIITFPTKAGAIDIGKDPKKSTEIACKMLSHLYKKYGKNAHQTVARAYNAGETRIDKARKGLGKPLTDETLNYYHQLLALQMLLDDMTENNIYGLR